MGAQVSREPPPPLPGGYVLGQQVYLMGPSETSSNGNRFEHGMQGQVVGPAKCENHKGKGVAVSFPGIKGPISCYLNHVRRRRRRAATRRFPPHQLPLLPAHRTIMWCGMWARR